MKKNKTATTKEQLQKQISEIEKQEHLELVKKHYPQFKRFEGKFFKVENHFSLPEKKSDRWFLYTKVVTVKKEDIYGIHDNKVSAYFEGWSFQTDKYKRISIEIVKNGYIHSIGQQITEKEFNEAWNELAASLDQLP